MRLRVIFWTTLSLWRLVLAADVNWKAYDRGELGRYPQTAFRSARSIVAPLIRVDEQHPACDVENEYVFLSPSAPRTNGNNAILVDYNGELVWWQRELGSVKSLQVQKFNGEDFITYWVGDEQAAGYGRGYYKMLDETYTLAHAFSALNGLAGDYHEFTITKDNTAIITAYEKIPFNLTSFGRESGWILDCIFQEIDIENDELLFEWRASHHFKPSDMAVNSWEEYVGTEQHPWDWFHLNSVEKDSLNNYLITARYTSAITYIQGGSGEPLWHLGGKQNSFTDLTGLVESFVDPHMARWSESYTAITLYDNIDYSLKQDGELLRSHGLKIFLDRNSLKVIDVTDFAHQQSFFALNEGSMQSLPNGNYFLSYGSAAIYSEFSANGTFLCSAHYAPLKKPSSGTGALNSIARSYRIYKHTWHGAPRHKPSIHMSPGKIFVSWNGATDVHSWRVEAQAVALGGKGRLRLIGVFPKMGFETEINLRGESYALYRLAALGRDAHPIRSWYVDTDGGLWETYTDSGGTVEKLEGWLSSFRLGCFAVIAACVWAMIKLNRNVFLERRQHHVRLAAGVDWPWWRPERSGRSRIKQSAVSWKAREAGQFVKGGL